MPPYESQQASPYPFRGRTAIITGSCGAGIGRSTALIDGVFLMFRSVLPIMRGQKYGRVVILGLSGAMGLQDMKDMAPDYCLGRAVRTWMTSAWAVHEYDHHICINIIEPGNVPGSSFNEAVSLVKEDRSCFFPGARQLTGHEIARIIVFLCSEAGRYISGSTIRIPTPILPVD